MRSKLKFIYKIFTDNLLVISAYFIFGLLGLELAVAPSNAGAVWPPAGIALASVLILGLRICPAIFIGNFCISAWSFGFDSASLSIYLATGCGAVAHAATGRYLIKRYVGFPSPLLEDWQILAFLLLGGPISCLIPASIGISTMTVMGIIVPAEIPVNWLSWWVGDTIGVLLFTPLILILFAEPKAIWRQRLAPVGFPLIFSFLLVTAFFLFIQNLEQNRHKQEFKQKTYLLTEALKHRIQDHLQVIDGINYLLIGSTTLKATDFIKHTQTSLDQFSELKLLKWQKTVYNGREMRLKTEFINQKEGTSDVQDNSREMIDSDGKFFALANRNQVYSEPLDNTIIFLAPVFEPGSQHPRGVLSSQIVISELIEQAFAPMSGEGIQLSITSAGDDAGFREIYSAKKRPFPKLENQYPVSFANQQWFLNFYRDDSNLSSNPHWFIWWFIISGLLFTCLLGTGLLLLTGRYVRTEMIVRQRTSDLLKAKNAAETANQAKNQFLAKISHELRTPLNGIMGFTQLLKKNTRLSTIEKHQINIISHCSEDLLTLINDILDIAAIENNKTKIVADKFDLLNLMADIVDMFKLKAVEKKLQFSYSSEYLPHYIIGDAKRIRQIITNVLTNAIKYTERGQVSFYASYQAPILEFRISDTGPGIAKNHLQSIFSPFTQINENGFFQEGIGIGLAICSELVKLMKGKITVDSEVNKGSTFTIKIPLDSPEVATQTVGRSHESKDHAGVNINVLIADDNEINRLLLSNLLLESKCSVDCASNGQEALNKINHHSYHLAFIDLSMPVMNGFELAEILKKQNNPLRLTAISAYADKPTIQKALTAGFDQYLTKPIDIVQINRLINQIPS